MSDLVPIEINLNVDPKEIDESFLVMFGGLTKLLLKYMFGGKAAPAKIRGTPYQVSAFASALGGEKRYMDAYLKYGLNDERTLSNRSKLNSAVSKFERETGLRWPYTS
tara:strand:+ start:177 stop:500 length:324 start_codon:yes stop_codon:yes gene_type:complete